MHRNAKATYVCLCILVYTQGLMIKVWDESNVKLTGEAWNGEHEEKMSL